MARSLFGIIPLALLLLWGCNGKTESKAPAAAGAIPSIGTVAVEAQLDEIPAPFPGNDLYNYVYVMRYHVRKVLRGTLADSVILVGHYNPRFARRDIKDGMDSLVDGDLGSFNPGDTHRLALIDFDSLGLAPALEDNYREPGRRWFALWASPSP